MKKIIYIVLAVVGYGLLVGCGATSKVTAPEISKTAHVTFTVEDHVTRGRSNFDCIYQIIKPKPANTTYFRIEPVREYVGSWWGGTWELELEPGSYASMLDNDKSFYRDFTANKGDKIKISYKNSVAGWAIDISKN